MWGTDTTPSLPSAPTSTLPMLVDLDGSGFGFTAAGICHNVSEADLEDLQTPAFAPPIEMTSVNS